MKIENIIKLSALVMLTVASASCQSKKKKAAEEAAAKAAAEEAARQKAAAEAAALAARTFELSDAVTAVASDVIAETAEDYKNAVEAAKKATAYGSTTFAVPTAGLTYNNEKCDLSIEDKAILQEFLNVFNATDKTAVILIEPYANDTKKASYNNAIAVERARLAANWLYAYQVPMRNVKVVTPADARKIDNSNKQRVHVSIK